MQRRAHILRRIIHHHKVIVRVGLPHILQHRHDSVSRGDQVCIAVFENRNTDSILPIDAGKALHLRVLSQDFRHRGNRDLPTALCREMDLSDLRHILILRFEADLCLPRIRIRRTRRRQLILLLQSRNHIIHGDAIVGQLIPIHLHRDFLIQPAMELHIRHAIGLREFVGERIIRHGIHLIQWVGRHHRQIDDRRRVHISLLHHRVVRIIRELSADGIHLLRRIDGRRIRVRVEIQLQRHLAPPGPRPGRDVLHIGHRRQRILHRLGDLLLHRLRIRPIIAHSDDHIRHIDIRIQLHPDPPITVQPQDHTKEDDHKNPDRMRHRVAGQIPFVHVVHDNLRGLVISD